MSRGVPTKSERKILNPWLIVLVTAPVPLLLFLYFFVSWYQQRAEFERVRSHFIERQNSVLGYNALGVAVGFSDLLEKAGRDVMVFSLLPPTEKSLLHFLNSQLGDFTRYDAKNVAVIQEPLPFYNRLAVLDLKGNTLVSVLDGKVETKKRTLAECQEADLCDGELYRKALEMQPGQTRYGRLLRYYTPEGVEENPKGASLAVVYRAEKYLYVVGIDYLQLRDHLTTPTFPYDTKRDLEQAYRKGNYIYIVDENRNVITHPLLWVQAGIDRATGKWMEPMNTDEDSGKRPINIAAYKGTKLKDYFDRLMRVSFSAASVDIFRASNLAGTSRVLSVVPITMSKGQYKDDKGTFGHAIIGCNVDHFEEPKDRFIPYY